MNDQNLKIMLNTNVIDAEKRIDDLISQFNEWLNNQQRQTSILLHFYTSDQFPMTMGELSRFMDECCAALENCYVEWNYATDLSLDKNIRLNVIISDSKTVE